MKKIIALVILVVMVIMGTAYAENAISPEANHHFIDCTKDYKAFMSGRKLRNDIDSTIGAVTGWCSNAATDTATFCANVATGVAKDIGNTATTCWNCACGFIDGLFS